MTAKLWDRGQVREFENGDDGANYYRARHFARVARIGLTLALSNDTLTEDAIEGWGLIECTRVDTAAPATLRPARATENLGLEVVL